MTPLPTFLIIGAQRCGTTTLYEGLRQHPEIYMSPNKEPSFFASEGEQNIMADEGGLKIVRDFDSYCALFSGVRNETAIGEASVLYLYSAKAPVRIKAMLPDARLIAILRNPVDRAYSHFLINRLYGWESLSDFGAALAAEEKRRQQGWSPIWFYRDLGTYSQQVERYLTICDPHQIRFFLYDDLQHNPEAVFQDIFRFLDVDQAFRVDASVKHNPSGIPKSRWLHNFLIKPNPVKQVLKRLIPENMQSVLLAHSMKLNMTRPLLSDEIRQRLLDDYREEILRTGKLIQRDLSAWLNGQRPSPPRQIASAYLPTGEGQ